jgi:DNA replication protein DnaC
MKRLKDEKLHGNTRWTQAENPSWEDFEEKRIFLPKDLCDKIVEYLNDGSCVITGPKNTGKTWLCYGVGFKLETENKPVWYIDDEDFKAGPTLEYIKGYCGKSGKTCYLIVEDCHRNSEETGKILKESGQIEKGNLRVLFTTEKIESDIPRDIGKIKLPEELLGDGKDYAKKIIEKFLEIENLRKYADDEDIENTAKRGGKNLSQLSNYLKDWVREKYFERGKKLSEIIVKREEKQHRENFEKVQYFTSIKKTIEKNTKFPMKEDFNNKLAYSDEITKENVKKILDSKRFCLLYGSPASRKTTFSMDLGLDLFDNDGYSVGYFEIEDKPNIDWRNLLQVVKSFDNKKSLFIIDDCHKLTTDTNLLRDFLNFIQRIKRETKNAKFLFVSRAISQEIMDPDSNYFDKLKNLVKLTTRKEVFEGIIERFCIHHKIENWEEQIGDVNKIKEEICGNNFLFLNWLLKTWGRRKRI